MTYADTAAAKQLAERKSRAAHWAGVLADLQARFEESDRQAERLIREGRALAEEAARMQARWDREDAELEALYGSIDGIIEAR